MNFVQRKIVWAKSNPLFWVNFVLWAVTVYVLFFWKHKAGDDSYFRYWSLALQLIGAATVWHDLIGSARDFGAAAIFQRNWLWLKAGLGFPTVISMTGHATSSSSASGVGLLSVHVVSGTSTEERLAALEAHMDRLDDQSLQAFVAIERRAQETAVKIREARAEVMREINSTNARLKGALVGNYSFLAFGSFWLVVGMFLSSLTPELSKIGASQDSPPPLPRQVNVMSTDLIKS